MPTLRLFLVAAIVASPITAWAGEPRTDHFESRVRPVLVEACVRCHGPDKASGGLRVDSREAILKGGDSGPAIVLGQPEKSLLLKAIRRLPDIPAMPPKSPLRSEAIRALEKWVREGAVWPATAAPVRAARHWSFETVQTVTPPPGIARQPIDAFILAKLHEKRLTPVGPADKRTLIRRATFDLTGLPPTPAEVEAFLTDSSTDAFARVVDRLLASPAYGEKWGRHWLDLVRYADTAGETADFPVPDAWRYRNYVIAAFNADRPYDQMLREQLAGDILASRLPANAPPGRYAELITATGYLAVARRFGFDIEKDHFLTIEDTIDTVGKSLFGLTLGCARCHDHKYDPVSAADYYALYGIFESTRFPFPGCEKNKSPRDSVPLLSPAALAEKREALRLVIGAAAGVKLDTILNRSVPHAYAVVEGSPHDAQLQKRGDPDARGDAIPRHFLTVLGGQKLPPQSGSGRLALAGWITDPKNPLTARVMVNRIWQWHFGTGLVATPSDFGTRGTPPTHPELLDWLAGRFIASGWSIKAMHRLMMLSEAYQRSSAIQADNQKTDPGNAYLWQFSRRRLDAEEIRDTLLAVSGDLDPTPGNAHPFPDRKSWGFTQHGPFSAVYETNHRSVYLMTQRIKRHPFLALFDGADTNASTATRQTTTVPTQALYFLNDPFVHARAESLANRVVPLPDIPTRVDFLCQRLYGRPADDHDRTLVQRLVADSSGSKAAWAKVVRVMFAANEFVYVD